LPSRGLLLLNLPSLSQLSRAAAAGSLEVGVAGVSYAMLSLPASASIKNWSWLLPVPGTAFHTLTWLPDAPASKVVLVHPSVDILFADSWVDWLTLLTAELQLSELPCSPGNACY
jgi:hypothetical protein